MKQTITSETIFTRKRNAKYHGRVFSICELKLNKVIEIDVDFELCKFMILNTIGF